MKDIKKWLTSICICLKIHCLMFSHLVDNSGIHREWNLVALNPFVLCLGFWQVNTLLRHCYEMNILKVFTEAHLCKNPLVCEKHKITLSCQVGETVILGYHICGTLNTAMICIVGVYM